MAIQILQEFPDIRHTAKSQSRSSSLYNGKAVYLPLRNKDGTTIFQCFDVTNHRLTKFPDTLVLVRFKIDIPCHIRKSSCRNNHGLPCAMIKRRVKAKTKPFHSLLRKSTSLRIVRVVYPRSTLLKIRLQFATGLPN